MLSFWSHLRFRRTQHTAAVQTSQYLQKCAKVLSALLWYVAWLWQRYVIRQLFVKTVHSHVQILKFLCAPGFFIVRVCLRKTFIFPTSSQAMQPSLLIAH